MVCANHTVRSVTAGYWFFALPRPVCCTGCLSLRRRVGLFAIFALVHHYVFCGSVPGYYTLRFTTFVRDFRRSYYVLPRLPVRVLRLPTTASRLVVTFAYLLLVLVLLRLFFVTVITHGCTPYRHTRFKFLATCSAFFLCCLPDLPHRIRYDYVLSRLVPDVPATLYLRTLPDISPHLLPPLCVPFAPFTADLPAVPLPTRFTVSRYVLRVLRFFHVPRLRFFCLFYNCTGLRLRFAWIPRWFRTTPFGLSFNAFGLHVPVNPLPHTRLLTSVLAVAAHAVGSRTPSFAGSTRTVLPIPLPVYAFPKHTYVHWLFLRSYTFGCGLRTHTTCLQVTVPLPTHTAIPFRFG